MFLGTMLDIDLSPRQIQALRLRHLGTISCSQLEALLDHASITNQPAGKIPPTFYIR